MAKYTQQQIGELAKPIENKIEEIISIEGEATSVAVATEQLTSEDAPSLSIGTMSAVEAIGSFVADKTGSEVASGAIGAIARQLAGINPFKELLDLEFVWDDMAALSTAVGANLLSNPSPDPATKQVGAIFLFYGETIPF